MKNFIRKRKCKASKTGIVTLENAVTNQDISTLKNEKNCLKNQLELESSKKQKRYIVFVGNLPYGVTKQEIYRFFKTLDIQDVRLLYTKNENKCRGCAFVEFMSPEAYTAALRYHRQKLDGRSIRVERTVGGGGKNSARQEKLKKVNRKLRRIRKNTWEKVRQIKESKK